MTHSRLFAIVALLSYSPAALADPAMLTSTGLLILAAMALFAAGLLGCFAALLKFRRSLTMLFVSVALTVTLLVLVSDLLNSDFGLTILVGASAAIPALLGSYLGHLLASQARVAETEQIE